MFQDARYIRIDDKPLFYIYDLDAIPDMKAFIMLWNRLAKENNLNGVFLLHVLTPAERLLLYIQKSFLVKSKHVMIPILL